MPLVHMIAGQISYDRAYNKSIFLLLISLCITIFPVYCKHNLYCLAKYDSLYTIFIKS